MGRRSAQVDVARTWIAATVLAVGIVACGASGNAGSPLPAGSCTDSGEEVQGLAWTPDSRFLLVMSGPSVAEALTITRIDASTLQKTGTIEAVGAFGPLTADDRGTPIWLAVDPNGNAWLETMPPDAKGPSSLGTLPHPRFSRLMWTTAGLRGIEYTAAPATKSRLVGISPGPNLAKISGLSEFDSITDIAVSLDGTTTATLRSNHIAVEGGAEAATTLAGGGTSVDIVADHSMVGYRPDDGHYRFWHLDGTDPGPANALWASTSALSPSGRLALAELSETVGPTGRVCLY